VLRRISGPKRNETTYSWRQLQNEELHNLHFSPNILVIRIIKSRRMMEQTWGGQEIHTGSWWKGQEEREH
jgi:hypothetical protein